jgi:hypothetical protein
MRVRVKEITVIVNRADAQERNGEDRVRLVLTRAEPRGRGTAAAGTTERRSVWTILAGVKDNMEAVVVVAVTVVAVATLSSVLHTSPLLSPALGDLQ